MATAHGLYPWCNWLEELPATGQLNLARANLERGTPSKPVAYLLKAMHLLGDVTGKSFLDVGCGVGHYSEWLERSGFAVRYIGVDISEHMIAKARREFPGRRFFVADMRELDYSGYDIVLASGLLSMLPYWHQGVEALCLTVGGLLILNRIQTHAKATQRYIRECYTLSAFAHSFNRYEFLDPFMQAHFRILQQIEWKGSDRSWSFVLERSPSRW